MDRGMYPTYFLHLDREDGKKVRWAWAGLGAWGRDVTGSLCQHGPLAPGTALVLATVHLLKHGRVPV